MVRRLTTYAALIACLFYATVLPWHGAMRVAAVMSEDAALNSALLSAICHGSVQKVADTATSPTAELNLASTSNDDAPLVPGADCEICKSLGAMSVAMLTVAALGVIERTARPANWSWPEQSVPDLALITPRSRGPPLPV